MTAYKHNNKRLTSVQQLLFLILYKIRKTFQNSVTHTTQRTAKLTDTSFVCLTPCKETTSTITLKDALHHIKLKDVQKSKPR